MSEKERLSFEEALKKLESIVAELENPDVALEKSMQLYEEGIRLSGYCSQTLENAALRIEKINDNSQSGHSTEESL
ncbi:MAG: exodeoxyribonuclease VII small subunit [Balneolaceae bacterium]